MPYVSPTLRRPYYDDRPVDSFVAMALTRAALEGRRWDRSQVMTLEIIDDEFVLSWSTK